MWMKRVERKWKGIQLWLSPQEKRKEATKYDYVQGGHLSQFSQTR